MAARAASTGKGKGLSGQALKQFKTDVAKLKKAGIVSPRVDARKQRATRYMMAKVRKNADILNGTAVAVKAPKEIRQKYTDKGLLEARGNRLIVPREYENQRARIKRGLVEVVKPMRNGREEYVILPFRPVDMPDLIRRLETDPTLEGLKRGDEYFSFRLYGHNSRDGFPNMEELAEYVELRYKHLFNGEASTDAVRHITFQRFKSNVNSTPVVPSKEPKLATFMPIDPTGRNGPKERPERIKKREREKKAKQRANETPQERATRLEKKRRNTAQWRQRKFDES